MTVVVNQLAASKAGSSTYQVGVEFDERRVKDVYALFGQPGDPLIIPPAYQAPVPCGSNVGPVDPSLLATHPDCLFDSFLTIGMVSRNTLESGMRFPGFQRQSCWTGRPGAHRGGSELGRPGLQQLDGDARDLVGGRRCLLQGPGARRDC